MRTTRLHSMMSPIITFISALYLLNTIYSTNLALPECLGSKQPMLSTLSIEGNRIRGPLPASLCDAAATLQYFVAHTNSINGSLPECLGSVSFPVLQSFILDRNELTGTIPEQ